MTARRGAVIRTKAVTGTFIRGGIRLRAASAAGVDSSGAKEIPN
jgi:hypothetical protein